jgi:predicted ferric reductase
VAFRLGQFVVLTFAGFAAGERHPFSMSSGGGEGELDVTVKASGDYTARLVDSLGPGDAERVLDRSAGSTTATVGSGNLDRQRHRRDAVHQLDPFARQRIRTPRGVLAFGARPGDAVYRDEIEAAAREHPTLRVHLVLVNAEGPLTVDAVLREMTRDANPWVYMCGPPL